MTEIFRGESEMLLLLRVIDRMRTYIHTFGLPGLPLLLTLLPLPLPLSHSRASQYQKHSIPVHLYS